MHNWTDNDNIIAYYLYRHPHIRTTANLELIAETLTIPNGSMGRKIGNFEYLDTNGKSGLSGYSAQAEAIYKQYKNMTDDELSAIAEKLLSRKGFDLSSLQDKFTSMSVDELESQQSRIEAKLADLREKLNKAGSSSNR